MAAFALAASLVLAPPMLLGGATPDGWHPILEDAEVRRVELLQALPLLAALLGLLGGAFSLSGASGAFLTSAHDPAPNPPAQNPPPPSSDRPALDLSIPDPGAVALASAVENLGAMLAEERRELAALREQCGAVAHEATIMGARLAGVALDAEARLCAGVSGAEAALREPASALLAAQDAMAARFAGVAEGAARKLGAVMDDAADQIAALSDAAAALRRDAGLFETALIGDPGRRAAAAE